MAQEQKPIQESLIGKTIVQVIEPEDKFGQAIRFVFSDGSQVDVVSCSCCGVWLHTPEEVLE